MCTFSLKWWIYSAIAIVDGMIQRFSYAQDVPESQHEHVGRCRTLLGSFLFQTTRKRCIEIFIYSGNPRGGQLPILFFPSNS